MVQWVTVGSAILAADSARGVGSAPKAPSKRGPGTWHAPSPRELSSSLLRRFPSVCLGHPSTIRSQEPHCNFERL